MVKITADSTCDLTPEIINDLDIDILPLHIVADNETYRDGVDITPADIFRLVEEEGKSCHTTAVNLFEYRTRFEELSARYDAVIHINIGSGFSSCHQNAQLAAQELYNVYTVDSFNLCLGSGALVHAAALMAQQGAKVQEILSTVRDMIPRVESSFVIDKLDYLRRGGRCSSLTEQGARLLQIRPCIEVVNNRMVVGKKYRGSFGRCLQHYIEDRFQDRRDIDLRRVYIANAGCEPDIVAMAKESTARLAAFEEIVECQAGCTISNHCGPNTVGIFFMRK